MRRVRRRPQVKQQVIEHQVSSLASASRMTEQLSEHASSTTIVERNSVVVDLKIGDNRINHGLSGRATGAHVSPSVCDAAFAWSFAADGDRQIVITVAGTDQPGAAVEIYR